MVLNYMETLRELFSFMINKIIPFILSLIDEKRKRIEKENRIVFALKECRLNKKLDCIRIT